MKDGSNLTFDVLFYTNQSCAIRVHLPSFTEYFFLIISKTLIDKIFKLLKKSEHYEERTLRSFSLAFSPSISLSLRNCLILLRPAFLEAVPLLALFFVTWEERDRDR